jgi:hypothetical protein
VQHSELLLCTCAVTRDGDPCRHAWRVTEHRSEWFSRFVGTPQHKHSHARSCFFFLSIFLAFKRGDGKGAALSSPRLQSNTRRSRTPIALPGWRWSPFLVGCPFRRWRERQPHKLLRLPLPCLGNHLLSLAACVTGGVCAVIAKADRTRPGGEGGESMRRYVGTRRGRSLPSLPSQLAPVHNRFVG